MFQANVPEKIIQQATGHRSLKAFRSYERVSLDQRGAVARVLTSKDGNASYAGELEEKLKSSSAVQVATSDSKTTGDLSGIFGNLSNCSIGRLTVNINPSISVKQTPADEFDELCSQMEVEALF